jgi:hypothetical protein
MNLLFPVIDQGTKDVDLGVVEHTTVNDARRKFPPNNLRDLNRNIYLSKTQRH